MKLEVRTTKAKVALSNNLVPGVIYGHGIESTPISIAYNDLRKALHDYGTSMTFEVTLNSEKHLVYVKDLQTDYMHNYKPVHVDFMKVSADDTITMDIPLNFLNRDEVGKAGEVLSIVFNEVAAEVEVGKGVSSLDVDLLVLNDVDGVYLKDIVVPEGITLLDDPDSLIANLTAVAELVTESDEEAVEADEEAAEEETVEEE